jgi:branched-chain amino acid transport system ATP-binding protein
MNAIEVSGLNTFYGKSHILHDVSLAAVEGSITTLLGRNGAGKTTTLRSIMGLTPARTGHVRIFGQDSTRMAPFRIARLGAGYVPEGRRVFANLTVEDNLKDRAVHHPPHLRTVSAVGRTPHEQRPPTIRWRAGDAVDRARPAVESKSPDS